MKKTLLATAIAGALGVSAAAQAATVYDQDGSKVDLYGRLAYGVTAGGAEVAGTKTTGSEIIDLGSRFGFRANHEVTSDMSVYARMEFRGKADANNNADANNQLGFDNIRNTYVGVKSNSWGDVMVGNFDNVVYRSGDVIFDVPENAGWESLFSISRDGRGDAVSYSTPNLEGFRAHVQAKHLSGNDSPEGLEDNSSTWTTAAAVDYSIDAFYVSLGYSQGKRVDDRGASYDGGSVYAAGEDLVGLYANYDVTSDLSLRVKYEEISDTDSQADLTAAGAVDAVESVFGIGATYDYGMGEIYGQYARLGLAWDGLPGQDGPSDKDRWVLGGNYRFSEPMYVFAEVYQEDANNSLDDSVRENFRALDDEILTTVGVRYDF
jgi:predicted porin